MSARRISAGDRVKAIRELIPVAAEAMTVTDAMCAICEAWRHIVALENAGVLIEFEAGGELYAAGKEFEIDEGAE